MAQLDANVADMPDQDSVEPLPAGQYLIEVTGSDVSTPERAQGRRVEVEYRVVAGPYDGRRGWDRFDIDRVANTKNGERMIDASRFKSLCAAVGIVGHIGDTTELHGIQFLATASIEPGDGQYAPKNRWNGFKPSGGAAPAQTQQRQQSGPAQTQQRQAAPAAHQQAGGGGRPGWMNRAGVGAR